MEALPPAMRFGDHLALDFLNSVAAPKGTTIEWLSHGTALLEWMVGAGTLDGQQAEGLMRTHGADALDEVAREARALREWFRRLLELMKHKGQLAVSERDNQRLNELMRLELSFPQIERENETLQLTTYSRPEGPRAILAPIARSMAELACQENLNLVSRCENPACTMWFYDRTKSHRRRWCSTTICGNRAKVAAFRERKRGSV